MEHRAPKDQELSMAPGAPCPAVQTQGSLDHAARSASTVGLWKEQSNPPSLTVAAGSRRPECCL